MTHALFVARSFGPPPPGAGKHPPFVAQLFGWLLVGVVVFLVFKFVRGQRNRSKAAAEAWAGALAGVVADIRQTVNASAVAAASGGDARSAVAVNLGQLGAGVDLEQLTTAVADRLGPVLRAELYNAEHRGPELLAADGERRGLPAVGSAGGDGARAADPVGAVRGGAGEGGMT